MSESLLCVANFPSGTGYAWKFIESLYAGVAGRIAEERIRTWVAYPRLEVLPAVLAGSAARPVELPIRLNSARSVARLLRFIRRERVRVLYLSDRPAWHPTYALLRLAGVRCILAHDHTSGERTLPRGVKRCLKWAVRRLPGMMADHVIGVSDFVARRKVEVDLIPARRVRRIWNSLEIPDPNPNAASDLRRLFQLDTDRPVVVCACRASPEKGVALLLRAFDALLSDFPADAPRPVLIYLGEGPALAGIRQLRESLSARDDIILAGYRPDAATLIEGADLCVVPSLWAEAFGLAVLEPMARGRAVIASRAGGIPEVAVDGETGVLVPPGDEAALSSAIRRLLLDAGERARLGRNGRERAIHHFSLDAELEELARLVRIGFRLPAPERSHVAATTSTQPDPHRSFTHATTESR